MAVVHLRDPDHPYGQFERRWVPDGATFEKAWCGRISHQSPHVRPSGLLPFTEDPGEATCKGCLRRADDDARPLEEPTSHERQRARQMAGMRAMGILRDRHRAAYDELVAELAPPILAELVAERIAYYAPRADPEAGPRTQAPYP